MPRAQIGSNQIKDDSLSTEDIKNGTILLEDLSQEVLDTLAAPAPGGTGIIDPFHNYTDNYVEESTTSSIWQTYLSITTDSLLELGEYRIMTSYTYRIRNTNAYAEIRLILDDTDVISLQRIKQKSTEQEKILSSDFANRTLQGVHTVKLQYRADSPNRIDVYMKEAKLELRRVLSGN